MQEGTILIVGCFCGDDKVINDNLWKKALGERWQDKIYVRWNNPPDDFGTPEDWTLPYNPDVLIVMECSETKVPEVVEKAISECEEAGGIVIRVEWSTIHAWKLGMIEKSQPEIWRERIEECFAKIQLVKLAKQAMNW